MDNSLQNTISTAWNKSKWIVKGGIIGLMALLMMIPMLYVKSLIVEREERQKQVTREIRSKWAGKQNIVGPVIGIPYWNVDDNDTLRKNASKNIAYFLPDQLDINAQVNPKEKHRGIFKVMLYDTKTTIAASFNELAIDKLNIAPGNFIWKEAFVVMNIADNKGLNEQLTINWRDSIIELSPQPGSEVGMTALLQTTSIEDFKNAKLTTTINLNGSEQLLFTPVGKSTTVKVSSDWRDPSFSGSMLPQTTEVNDNGFTATWKSMSHKRNFPQQWIGNAYKLDIMFPVVAPDYGVRFDGSNVASANTTVAPSNLISASSFGVDLFIPVNGYQKTLRTIKYALLCILLTFAAFFLIETANKKSAHPFQYGLIGLALILFYTLLLSISEYTGFNAAYLIASAATIGLIAWFVRSILDSGRATTLLSVVLVLIYSYVFSLLQLQDYSLLLGSIGLFLTLAVVMKFSKKMQW
ncbi:cell envelope integrity protein CreD [Chitinophagaceae bacterium IBVUCB2]|nr:cell envelope integrity protein CreD [Chitinophagaceae bacterium IBVUCB2]